ncbi:DUF3352 domain-containing protein [bacterium]|nr:DUF3352 domain-containing protein [candidate division CSSED10-310 bacterium]
MKSKWFVLFGMCFVLLGIFAGCQKAPPEEPPIPDNVLFYMKSTNLEATWDKITTTKLSQDIKNLEIWNNPFVKQAFSEMEDAFKEAEEQMGIPINKQTFMAVFGKRFDMAIVPGPAVPYGIFIADMSTKATGLKILDYIQKEAGSANVRTEKYKNQEFTVVNSDDDMNLAYFFSGDRLIFTTDIEAAKMCADILAWEKPLFFESDKYKGLSESMKSQDDLMYIDIRAIIDTYKAAVPDDLKMQLENIDYDQIIVGSKWNEKGLTGAVELHYPSTSKFLTLFGDSKLTGETARWIPENPLFANGGAIKFQELYDVQKTKIQKLGEIAGKDVWDEIDKELQQELNISLDQDIRPWLGDGAFLSIHRVNSQGTIPMPETVIGIGIKDKSKAEAFVNKIQEMITDEFGSRHLKFQTLDIDGMQYHYVPLPFGPNIMPGYLLTDNFLVLATSQTGITDSIKAYKGETNNFTDSKAFKDIESLQSGKTIGFQYWNNKQLMTSLSDLINNYRMFFPEEINPDQVQAALNSLGSIEDLYSDIEVDQNRMNSSFQMTIK